MCVCIYVCEHVSDVTDVYMYMYMYMYMCVCECVNDVYMCSSSDRLSSVQHRQRAVT